MHTVILSVFDGKFLYLYHYPFFLLIFCYSKGENYFFCIHFPLSTAGCFKEKNRKNEHHTKRVKIKKRVKRRTYGIK